MALSGNRLDSPTLNRRCLKNSRWFLIVNCYFLARPRPGANDQRLTTNYPLHFPCDPRNHPFLRRNFTALLGRIKFALCQESSITLPRVRRQENRWTGWESCKTGPPQAVLAGKGWGA
jgi:hypothetical protein